VAGVPADLGFVSSRDLREGLPRPRAVEWSHGLASPGDAAEAAAAAEVSTILRLY
jgi:hypothetical protein